MWRWGAPPLRMRNMGTKNFFASSRGRRTEGELDTPIAKRHHVPQETNWRYVTGAFQVKIPVSKAAAGEPADREASSIPTR